MDTYGSQLYNYYVDVFIVINHSSSSNSSSNRSTVQRLYYGRHWDQWIVAIIEDSATKFSFIEKLVIEIWANCRNKHQISFTET